MNNKINKIVKDMKVLEERIISLLNLSKASLNSHKLRWNKKKRKLKK